MDTERISETPEVQEHQSPKFRTSEIALAAFLRVRGYEPTLIPPEVPSGFLQFAFDGNPEELEQLAEEFGAGGSVPAFRYYSAVTALRGEIRLAKGGWR
ncbi:hypothetical protein ACFL3S_05560 [Gemmatimonadota bacterium]